MGKALWSHGYHVTHMHDEFTPGEFEEVLCWKRVGADPAEYLAQLFGDEFDLYVVHIPESEGVERAERGAGMATAVLNIALLSALRPNSTPCIIQSTDRAAARALAAVRGCRQNVQQWMWAAGEAERTRHRTVIWRLSWPRPMQGFTSDEKTLSAKGRPSWEGMAHAFVRMLPKGDLDIQVAQQGANVPAGDALAPVEEVVQ